jgi:hypothetical protein
MKCHWADENGLGKIMREFLKTIETTQEQQQLNQQTNSSVSSSSGSSSTSESASSSTSPVSWLCKKKHFRSIEIAPQR